MISAMPAVSVRHVRHHKRRRPSQLALQPGARGTMSPSPTPSSQHRLSLFQFCNQSAVLHGVVGSLLLGIVVLVVGLVQLSPGAEAAQHRYYLLGVGSVLMAVGIVSALLRCLCLRWYRAKMQQEAEVARAEHASAAAAAAARNNDLHNVLINQSSVTSPPEDSIPIKPAQKNHT